VDVPRRRFVVAPKAREFHTGASDRRDRRLDVERDSRRAMSRARARDDARDGEAADAGDDDDAGDDERSTFVVLAKKRATSGKEGAKEDDERRRRRRAKANAMATTRATLMSKKEKRRALKVEQDKKKRDAREEVMTTLKAHAVNDVALSLMRSTTSLGARETAREKLKRALKAERAGVTLEELSDARLTKRMKPINESEDVSESEDESEDEDEGANRTLMRGTTTTHEEEANDVKDDDEDKALMRAAIEAAEAAGLHSMDDATRELVKTLRARAQTGDKDDTGAVRTSFKGLNHEVFKGCSFVVPVHRTEAIQASRSGLPIVQEEHEIVDAINTNPVTVICGSTGCGKTTQVPQFLYEAGYGDAACESHPGAVAVTQPRRVAVTSTARRVAEELNVPLGGDVGYQIRYDKNVGENPRVKFMTDGILLREVQTDFLLRRYSVVIIDEAHERSVNTDILLGLLSRIVPLRAALAAEGKGVTPLRLVVMSATLRVEEFVENKKLCPTPPALLQVATRQFPVTVHFSRKTEHADYVAAATKKVLAIHRKLPPGGILIFLTGQKEVEAVCRKLRQAYPINGQPAGLQSDSEDENAGGADSDGEMDTYDVDAIDAAGEDVGEDGADDFDGEDDISDIESDISEEEEVQIMGGEGVGEEEAAEAEAAWTRAHTPSAILAKNEKPTKAGVDGPGGLNVLPLYALLPQSLQQRVFMSAPDGSRMVIVATNVAETSLTIPGIRYVVDAGRAKERIYERDSGLSRFTVGWISKASADQRAGRAGRTSPGHCYRLFSSAHFVDEMKPHAAPQILGVPVEGVVLQMRAMGIDKVINFPFISPPEKTSLMAAEKTLQILGAVERGRGAEDVGRLTALGRAMAVLPISPRHSRMLFAAAQSVVPGCLSPAIAIAAALSMDSPFLRGSESDEIDASTNKGPPPHVRFHHPNSDALSAVQAVLEYDQCRGVKAKEEFCSNNRLHEKTMREMSDLRRQLQRMIVSLANAQKIPGLPKGAIESLEVDFSATTALPPGGSVEIALRQALCSGWADRIARRAKQQEIEQAMRHAEDKGQGKQTKATRYVPALLDVPVFLHPTSSLHRSTPDYVVYTDLLQTEKRPYIVGATAIEPEWLIEHASALVDRGTMLSDPSPRYASSKDKVVGWIAPAFGPHRWELPLYQIDVESIDVKCAVFASALLSGAVSPPMSELREKLAAKPLLACRPEGKTQMRVVDLLGALKRYDGGICTRAQLSAMWAKNPRYLYNELKAWMKTGKAYALETVWGAVVRGVTTPRLSSKNKDGAKKKTKKLISSHG